MNSEKIEKYADILNKYAMMLAGNYSGEEKVIDDLTLKRIEQELFRHAGRLATTNKDDALLVWEAHSVVWEAFLAAVVELGDEQKGED